uniref:Cytoplasmic tRNA 2-thiolation protein 2 n=1 Tax=Sinocyclocheilus grahami TaxID=75366 RepID=A0A672KLD5_SINGR
MCQAEEEYNGLECKQEKIPVPTLNRKCIKCKEGTAVLVKKRVCMFTGSCFKEYFIHKLRAMLGNNRVIFPHEKVLLAVSGGTASYSMLSQVQEVNTQFFLFICVEDSAYSPEHKLAVERLFSSLKILIAKEDMLQTLRQHLILHIARENGYSKVMMGDSCSRLAVKLLSNITLGRRAALGFSDHRYGDVVIVRPMRDYSFKEITYYSRMFNVPSVFISGLDTKTHDKASIQRLTESFVTNLQADFPSTVSTIYRNLIQSVMSPQSQTAEAASKCLLCLCALDTKAGKASAFNATLVSEQLSQIELQDPSVEAPARSAEEGQGCGSSNRLPSHQDLKTLLCYSCRLTIKDMVNTLPPYIITEAEKQQKRWEMLLRNLNE